MKYIDPTGRDITAEGDSQDDYLKWLQSKLSFNIKLEQNPNGTSTVALGDNQMAKEQIMGSLNRTKQHWYSTGSGSDRAPCKEGVSMGAPGRYRSRYCTAACTNVACCLRARYCTNLACFDLETFQAIIDPEHHVTINTGNGEDPPSGSFIDTYRGNGRQDIYPSEVRLLDGPENKGGYSPGDVALHATVEAYSGALNPGTPARPNHEHANDVGAPGLDTLGGKSVKDSTLEVGSTAILTLRVTNRDTIVRFIYKYDEKARRYRMSKVVKAP